MPNSATPISPDQIQAGRSVLQQMADLINQANQNMNAVITRKDLNVAGMPLATAGGTPGKPGVVLPFDNAPVPASANAPARLENWPTMCVGRGVSMAEPTPRVSTAPVKAAPMKPLTIPPVGAPVPVAAPAKKVTMPTTGNPCIDLQKGYILQSQVTPQQLMDCINKEYFLMGSKGRLTAEQQLWQNENFATLPKVADDPNVPKYDQKTMGLAGTSEGVNSMILWGSIGLGAAALWLAKEYSKGKR